MNLQVSFGPLMLKNPILTASGTSGYGSELSPFIDLSRLGGIVGKTIFLESRAGNPPERIVETPSGMLNSIGLQGGGIDDFLTKKLPVLRELGCAVFVSIGAHSFEEFTEIASRLEQADGIDALEINISCPNIKEGGMEFAQNADLAGQVVQAVRKGTVLPIFAKLSPNVTDVALIAKVVEVAGADGISVINTVLGMAVDWKKRRPVLAKGMGGLSGPAIKPIALRIVWEVSQAVKIPIIGIGGIMNAKDVLEFMVAGASAVQIGTANYINPKVCEEILEELPVLLEEQGIDDIQSLVGTLSSVQ